MFKKDYFVFLNRNVWKNHFESIWKLKYTTSYYWCSKYIKKRIRILLASLFVHNTCCTNEYNMTSENYRIHLLFDLWICLLSNNIFYFNKNHITHWWIRRARAFPERSRRIVRLVLHNRLIYETIESWRESSWYVHAYRTKNQKSKRPCRRVRRKTVITDRTIFVFQRRRWNRTYGHRVGSIFIPYVFADFRALFFFFSSF